MGFMIGSQTMSGMFIMVTPLLVYTVIRGWLIRMRNGTPSSLQGVVWPLQWSACINQIGSLAPMG